MLTTWKKGASQFYCNSIFSRLNLGSTSWVVNTGQGIISCICFSFRKPKWALCMFKAEKKKQRFLYWCNRFWQKHESREQRIITLGCTYEKIMNEELILYLQNSNKCHKSVINGLWRWEESVLGVPTHSKQARKEKRTIQSSHHPKAPIIFILWYSQTMVHINFISPQAFVWRENL